MPSLSRHLAALLEAAGQSPIELIGAAGETITILPHGGRVIGLCPRNSDTNFLWTNPLLATDSAFFRSTDWQNSGGDRTWVAPEVDFFFPKYPDTAEYFAPRQLDPGNYKTVASDDDVVLKSVLTVRSSRSGSVSPLRITKRVQTVANPLRLMPASNLANELEFAGYQLHTSLEPLTDLQDGDRVGLWNLLQMPHGGDMLVPTHYSVNATNFIGSPPASDIDAQEKLVKYRMQAAGVWKISIPALAVTGRAGYLFEQDNAHSLVVRAFFVDPGGTYVDVNPQDSHDGGYAFQACNVNTQDLGAFAELEYHAPAIGSDTGRSRSDDVSCVWAYRGGPAEILAAAEILLGVSRFSRQA